MMTFYNRPPLFPSEPSVAVEYEGYVFGQWAGLESGDERAPDGSVQPGGDYACET
jgi:uncharacterized protein YdiU (UPF0061 family)